MQLSIDCRNVAAWTPGSASIPTGGYVAIITAAEIAAKKDNKPGQNLVLTHRIEDGKALEGEAPKGREFKTYNPIPGTGDTADHDQQAAGKMRALFESMGMDAATLNSAPVTFEHSALVGARVCVWNTENNAEFNGGADYITPARYQEYLTDQWVGPKTGRARTPAQGAAFGAVATGTMAAPAQAGPLPTNNILAQQAAPTTVAPPNGMGAAPTGVQAAGTALANMFGAPSAPQ